MKNKIILSFPILALSLSSCGKAIHYDLSYYRSEIPFHDNFLICQLDDLHFSTLSNLDEEFSYVNKLVYSYSENYDVKPDLIILNGDTFHSADKYVVNKVLEYFDSLEIPFALTYGNHDYQGMYSNNYITYKLSTCKNSLFRCPDYDDVYGQSNFYINLNDNGNTKFQIICIDSNSYKGLGFDTIHQDQVDWYKRVVDEVNIGKSEDSLIKNMVFAHIPINEFTEAVNKFTNQHPNQISYKDDYCSIEEGISYSNFFSYFVTNLIDKKCTVSFSAAHNHMNNVDLKYTKDDYSFRLIYGSKSSRENYVDLDNIGALFYSVFDTPKVSKKDPDNLLYFGTKRVHLTYNFERSVIWENEY